MLLKSKALMISFLLLSAIGFTGCPTENNAPIKLDPVGPFENWSEAIEALEMSYQGFQDNGSYSDVKIWINLEDRTKPVMVLLSPTDLKKSNFIATVDDGERLHPIDVPVSVFRGEYSEQGYDPSNVDFVRMTVYRNISNQFTLNGLFVFENRYYELLVQGPQSQAVSARRVPDADLQDFEQFCGISKNHFVSTGMITDEIQPQITNQQFDDVRFFKTKIPLEADAALYEKMNQDALVVHGYMISVMNNVAGIYEKQLNVQIQVSSSNVNIVEAISDKTEANALLDDLRAWGRNKYGSGGTIIHLFTGKDLDGSIIGIAWGDALCNSYRFGLSQYLALDRVFSAAALTAHEIGHNFAMHHDEGCVYADPLTRYLMCPNLNVTSHVFSPKSLVSSEEAIKRGYYNGCLDPQY